MAAGPLRDRVSLQSATETQVEGRGEVTKAWATYDTVWSNIVPLSGSERIEALKVTPGVTHTCRMRYRSDIDPAHRLLWGGRIFNIESVLNEDERREWLILSLKEDV
jgi:SPP1 family predicted phage head-tail adaptor